MSQCRSNLPYETVRSTVADGLGQSLMAAIMESYSRNHYLQSHKKLVAGGTSFDR